MIKLNKLKGKIAENGYNYTSCSEGLGINPSSFSRRMNGKLDFTIKDIKSLGELLNLTNDDIRDIFLS